VQQIDDGVSTCAFAPIRLAGLATIVHVKMKHKGALLEVSEFTLHTAIGFRMSGGGFQVEHIAGFCHLRNCLKSYPVEQIGALQDPETSEDIGNLERWLASGQRTRTSTALRDALSAKESTRSAHDAIIQARQRRSVTRAIDKAIACAVSWGLDDVAERLTSVREALGSGATSPRCGNSDTEESQWPSVLAS
jgi:hypothetical protein